jgi:hypothetical protein
VARKGAAVVSIASKIRSCWAPMNIVADARLRSAVAQAENDVAATQRYW